MPDPLVQGEVEVPAVLPELLELTVVKAVFADTVGHLHARRREAVGPSEPRVLGGPPFPGPFCPAGLDGLRAPRTPLDQRDHSQGQPGQAHPDQEQGDRLKFQGVEPVHPQQKATGQEEHHTPQPHPPVWEPPDLPFAPPLAQKAVPEGGIILHRVIRLNFKFHKPILPQKNAPSPSGLRAIIQPRYHLNFPGAGTLLSSVTGSPAAPYCQFGDGARKPPSPGRTGDLHRPSPLWRPQNRILLFRIALCGQLYAKSAGLSTPVL